jgi:peptidoglycan/xylan/chitin deacetylase (PgdA/CDA1 family)
MHHLAGRYHVVALGDVLGAFQTGTDLPENAVLVTFDDAYADFGQIAWPILKHFGLPATLFVPTAYPGRPDRSFWWDRLYRAIVSSSRPHLEVTLLGTISLRTPGDRHAVLQHLRSHLKTVAHQDALSMVDDLCFRLGVSSGTNEILSWDELRRLSREGVTLAAHTRTHPVLTQISPDTARDEIVGSQQDLQLQIGQTLPVFCFPGGYHNDTVVSILKQEGFKLAFTTERGYNSLGRSDPWRLRRINITRRTSPSIFRLRLTGLGMRVDAWRYVHQRRPQ